MNPKFQKQETPEHVWVIAYDTICQGQQATIDEDCNICLFTEKEADDDLKELYEHYLESHDEDDTDPPLNFDEWGEYYKVHMNDYIHERKLVYGDEGAKITGFKPL